MKLKTILMAGAMSIAATGAWADCAFENEVPLKSLSAGFEAWKAVTDAMAECGNFSASLDQEFREKQPEAFAADPALYQIGGVSNATLVPLLNAGTIRPLDDLVEKYGQDLLPNQLIKVDGKTMAIAMMVNAQHLMYRDDVLAELGIEEPKTYDDVLAAAAKIKEAGVMDYPIGGTFKTGWNLGQEFVNMYLGEGGSFFGDGNVPTINNEQGVAALETLKAMTEYMDPEYLVSDSTYVQQQFQQGKIAMANLWASRAAAMNDEAESQVVGKVTMAAAPMGSAAPATTIWWDGIVLASNMSDEEADAAFRVALEGMDGEMVSANNDVAVWLSPAYSAGALAAGAAASAEAGAKAYPASGPMGIMHTALGNGLADYLTGAKDAQTTLADIEADYITAAKEAGLISN
ncbi:MULTISPECIES: ABC transporter substrate-binding protein [Ruegeria]|jgi:ABC-type glycerol-3-phosphate transport system substrate-binding protein|uniref:Extracellular solute-binding protein n=1 Tax=Ruegeria atlantica TaxID=81569 RepID=A0ABX1WA46_9RHOB|nr:MULTISPECIES: extracellular solute-binding protein [Ruegeria]NOC83263.1 extracellular solute-binding protein [Ruegeria sp. HKCCD6428]NOD30172.1 extracellular solute-binding protein [Ruegeria atlantica]NOD97928.1 extracellular solute-binding protein [Ruegeria sp. HKCCD6228]QFT74985.1 Bacterial extracellular solute-binding protein [Ruegeria sp. THAF33]